MAGSVAAAGCGPMYRAPSANRRPAAVHRFVFISLSLLPHASTGYCQQRLSRGKARQCSLSVSPLMSRLSSTSMETMPTAVSGGTASPARAMNHR
jgi:hypothetical protein